MSYYWTWVLLVTKWLIITVSEATMDSTHNDRCSFKEDLLVVCSCWSPRKGYVLLLLCSEDSLSEKTVLFEARGQQLTVFMPLAWSIVHRCSVSPAPLSCLRGSSLMACVLFALGQLHSAAVLSDWISASIRQLLDAESHVDWFRCWFELCASLNINTS